MPPHPHEALAVYAEPLVVRRRVVVLGDDSGGVSERLSELGARMVVTLRPGEGDGDLRPASFDLALIPDLGVFEDPAVALALARRLVGDAGAALVAAANRDALGAGARRAFDYYALFDLVAREFPHVKMVAQVPFHGVALAELGAESESPPVTVDAQLVDEPAMPTSFLALGSHRGAQLDPYVIVEVPGSGSAAAAPMAPVVDPAVEVAREVERLSTLAALDSAREQLAAERGRAGALEASVASDRQQGETLLAELEAERRRLANELFAERARIAPLTADLESLRGVVLTMEALEREVAARGRALVELSAEVDRTRAAAEASTTASARAAAFGQRAERAERLLAQVEPELAALAEGQAVEVQRMEEALRERAHAVQALEAEVARRDRMVRELAATIGDGATSPGSGTAGEADVSSGLVAAENARLRERLDAMALELARHEAAGQASTWAVAELERRLTEGNASKRADAPRREADDRLGAVLDELDALKTALAQEHDQRLRAEAALASAAAPSAAASTSTQS